MRAFDIDFPNSESYISRYRSQIKENILKSYSVDDLETAIILARIPEHTVCVGFFAGAGSRWTESLREAQQKGSYPDIDLDKPRCLAPVQNMFKSLKYDKTAIGSYNAAAFKGLGAPIVVYGSYENEIQENIFQTLGIQAKFFKQQIIPGKKIVSGHGDAIMQARELLLGSRYTVTYFSNDPHSRKSALLSILTFDYLQTKFNNSLDLLIPAAFMEKPKYPLTLDSLGAPIDFAHNKLRHDRVEQTPGFSNIGVRIYKTSKLLEAIGFFEDILKRKGGYDSINNGTDELALDNIDKYIMDTGKKAILPVCYGREIESAKRVHDIPNFLRAMKENLEEHPV